MIEDAYHAIKLIVEASEKYPVASRAVRIFLEHAITRGESIKESLVKTGEILAAEALI
jgi:hypothetical protein